MSLEPRLKVAEPPFSVDGVKELPRPAHATAFLPPCVITLQRQCSCSAPNLVAERSLYIQKEAELRRSQADLKEAESKYREAMRELRILQTIMEGGG